MSNNNGTGFWVVAALIAALSIAALVEGAIRVVMSTGSKAASENRPREATHRA